MRILKLGVYYPAYLRQFYGQRPALAAQDYATQHAALMTDAFGSADFWTTALADLGHVTADLVINAEPLQRAWAREHDVSWPESGWELAVGAAQVKAFRPDVLLVADYTTVTYEFLRRLQAECPSIRLTLLWCGAPYNNGEVFRACDVVLSCVPELVAEFRAQGLAAEHVNHAFAPRILGQLPGEAESVDVSFLGSISLAGSFHRERARILAALAEKTSLRIWTDVDRPSLRQRAGQQARMLAFDAVAGARGLGATQQMLAGLPLVRKVTRWTERPGKTEILDPRIRRRAQPALYGLAMFDQLQRSRVTLNTHIEIARHSASNMRMFEATGVGACLLTDRKQNLAELFEPESEVVSYGSVAECLEKVRYLLDHESERAAIAAAGQRRTLRDHTFAHRVAQLDALIRERMTPKERGPSIWSRLRRAITRSPLPPSSFEEVEQAEREFYRAYVREGMTVFDVGAHIGELTLLFARLVGNGTVHAFEAAQSCFDRLRTNCESRNVLLHHLAVAEREGEIELQVYDDAHLAWNTRAIRPLASYGIDVTPVGSERVPAIALDDYCERNAIANIDLLKIDVEGAELQVLRGAQRLLAEQRVRCVAFEFGQTTFDMGNTPEQLEELLERNGYAIRNLMPGQVPFPGREGAASAQFAMQIATPQTP